MVKVSIIVPCYNQEHFLDECLQSVLNQTFHNWECLIVNDGSPDNTEDVARKWVEKDMRFKYFFKKNGGVSSARNFGIERAIGKWILPLDGDDHINADYLLNASKYFNEDFKIIYGNIQKFGGVNEEWILPVYTREKMAVFNIIHNSAFYRKEDFIKVGGYDVQMKHGLEDWEYWINLLKDGGEVKHLPQIYLHYRIQEKSRTTGLDIEKFEEMVRYIESKHIRFFHETLGTFHQLFIENLDLKTKVNGRVYRNYTLLLNFFRKNK